VVALEPIDGVVVVHVRESEGKPVQCREGFFSREGAATQKLSRDELRNFFRREGAVRFDTSFDARFRFPEDFDFEKFELWRSLSGVNAAASVEDVLVNLEVAERSPEGLRVHNGGVLFFARKPRRFFNQAYITCILYRGTGRVDIIDRKDLEGGLVADIEESLRFIERNTRTAYRIKSLKRQDIPEYPMTALREAIVNAVIHRDWFVYGANVFVEIHADRIDIVSPGGLFGGVTQDLLGKKAVRRNPLLADLFQRIGFIEKAGTGIERMRQDVRAHGSPEPVFVADTFFTATFRPLRAMEFEHLGPDGHERAHDEAHDEAHGRVERTDHPPLSESERRIVEACRDGGATRGYLMQFGEFSVRSGSFKRAMTHLLVQGLIEMTLPEKPRSRNQRYRATAKGRRALAALASLRT
jgi:ATP-dependent DNA helicase RecG